MIRSPWSEKGSDPKGQPFQRDKVRVFWSFRRVPDPLPRVFAENPQKTQETATLKGLGFSLRVCRRLKPTRFNGPKGVFSGVFVVFRVHCRVFSQKTLKKPKKPPR